MSDLKEQILGKKNLCSYYYPNGDTKKEQLHDDNCAFCRHYEDEVMEAMEEYATEMLKQANDLKTSASGLHIACVVGQSELLCPKCGCNKHQKDATEPNKCINCGELFRA
jgi:hypothetical protein